MKKPGLWTRIKGLFGGLNQDREAFYEDMEDRLIEADLGMSAALEVSRRLKNSPAARSPDPEVWKAELQSILASFLQTSELPPAPASGEPPLMILVLGVNGVGKTTTIAKLGRYYRDQQKARVLLAAGDTFRAAAIEQLLHHGKKLELRTVHHQAGSDPAAVIYDACDSARARGEQVIIADTAGRLHNKEHLIRELDKIDRIAQSRNPGAPYKRFLVLDATTGQNGLRQAQVFHEEPGKPRFFTARRVVASAWKWNDRTHERPTHQHSRPAPTDQPGGTSPAIQAPGGEQPPYNLGIECG